MNSPVAIALDHVDLLFDRIRLAKLKKYEETNLNPLRNLNAPQLTELNNHLKLTTENIKAAVAKDEFFQECYSFFDTAKLKIASEYLKAIRTLKPSANATGKMRVAKTKRKQTPDAIVKKVLFLQADKETEQTSLNPRELVGARELWVYNAKTRKLGCYYAKKATGLSAKGTTILEYDETISTTKTLRKPKEQVRKFMMAGKSFWDTINAVPQVIGSRMNRDTLILRVVGN
jgi:hypothetical protein